MRGEELKNKIIEYATGDEYLSDNEIARRCECSQPYVSKLIKSLGIKRKEKINWENLNLEIVKDIAEGKTIKQIAEEAGVLYCTMWAHIEKLGIISRDSDKKAVKGKREHGEKFYDSTTHRTYYDWTDYYIDRPCICTGGNYG